MLVSPTPHRLSRIVTVVCALVGLASYATAQQSSPHPVLPDVQSSGHRWAREYPTSRCSIRKDSRGRYPR
jgi:hypothetical protein